MIKPDTIIKWTLSRIQSTISITFMLPVVMLLVSLTLSSHEQTIAAQTASTKNNIEVKPLESLDSSTTPKNDVALSTKSVLYTQQADDIVVNDNITKNNSSDDVTVNHSTKDNPDSPLAEIVEEEVPEPDPNNTIDNAEIKISPLTNNTPISLGETPDKESENNIAVDDSPIEKPKAEPKKEPEAPVKEEPVKKPEPPKTYPAKWANAPKDAYVDDWGMYTRECVSYAAWKVASSGRHMPNWGGHGNANEWLSNAKNDGIPTGSEPKAGAIAFWNYGYYGHVAHVDEILPGGKIKISEYNYGMAGKYGERVISASDAVAYIYF